ncbi:MAG TPA: cupin domain-containing protein [Terriglobales bacterium]|nr:cupin domain-containing protein [Terriglobales bacterium]
MDPVIIRRFEKPDEVVHFEKGKFETVRIGSLTVGRATYEPGWKWSQHAKGSTPTCQLEHVVLIVSGRTAIAMDNGQHFELGPGDLAYVAPGHDAWVLGDEPYVSLHFLGAEQYGK